MIFFEQYFALRQKTPRIGSVVINSTNCDYNINMDRCKNCYLLCNAVNNQDCMYGRDFYENSDCIDCDHIFRCTLCHECVHCQECWNSENLQDCTNCQDCDSGFDLKDCRNCIGCAGLRKKEFYIFNKPYKKDEFLKLQALLSRDEIKKKFEEVKLATPRTFSAQIATENCFGDMLYHCKNAFYAFDCNDCEDILYTAEGRSLKVCMDIFVLEYSDFCYNCSSNYKLNNSNFCYHCTTSSELEFCELVFNSKNCFGCVGINHKEYHILNQPYSKEEYFKRIAEIKAELRREKDYGAQFWNSTYPIDDTVANWPRL